MPGGSETYLAAGGQIENTQSAMVLEKLINRLFSAFASKGDSRRVRRRRQNDVPGFAARFMQGISPRWCCWWSPPCRARRTGCAGHRPARPQKLIETSSHVLLADLDANRAKYRKDITQLYKVVDTIFLPHVDVDFAAQQVLGKHWRTATPDQRKRFVDGVLQLAADHLRRRAAGIHRRPHEGAAVPG